MNWMKILSTSALLIFLIWLTAFFAGSETAYLSMTNIRLRKMFRERKAGAKKVRALFSDIDGLLTVILVGINFTNTLASSIATALAIELVGGGGVGIATAAVSFFITVFGQIVPKTIAGLEDNVEKVAARNAAPLAFLKKIFFPVVWVFSKVSKGAVFLMQKIWRSENSAITEEELKILIESSAADGTLEKSEKNMLDKILEISDFTLRNIMKHRSLVTYISIADSYDTVVAAFKNSGFSHLPVCAPALGDESDSKENVVGVLYYKDVLFSKKRSPDFSPAQFMKSPLFVPETFSIIELIQVFKKENRSFAVALDEQGSTAGIVTLDDVMRGLFGRMSDAGNHNEIPAEARVKIISPKEFLVPGDMHLNDVNSILNMNLQSENFSTLGGWLLEKFDSLPSSGEALRFDEKLFIVEDQSQRRITLVRIRKL